MNNNNYRIRVLPYKAASQSAKSLALSLGGKRLKTSNSRFVAGPTDILINWGNSKGWPCRLERVPGLGIPVSRIYNCPDAVGMVVNKLAFFEEFSDTKELPDYWTNQEDIPDEAFPIVCRTKLTGSSGAGIVIATCRSDLVPAPLYVKYIKKQEEFRVHIMEDNPFLVQQKKRRLSYANPNWQIRNHANGFIYSRNDVCVPDGVLHSAVNLFLRTGLDFGAVDVIWNENRQRAYVLEVNTAPGLEGSTLDDYANAFKEVINEL